MIIPLGAGDWPDSPEALRAQIEAGLGQLGVKSRAIEAVAPAWPAIEKLSVDLTGAQMDALSKLTLPEGRSGQSLQIAQLDWRAEPGHFQGLALDTVMQVQGLTVEEATGGQRALVLRQLASGSLAFSAAIAEIERLVQRLLDEKARAHGGEVSSVKLRLTPRGPRSLSLAADVAAKAMFMRAQLSLTGDLDADEELNVRFSKIELHGSGMIVNVVRGFLQAHIDKLQKSSIGLGQLSIGGMNFKVRNAQLAVEGERLRVSGDFAG